MANYDAADLMPSYHVVEAEVPDMSATDHVIGGGQTLPGATEWKRFNQGLEKVD